MTTTKLNPDPIIILGAPRSGTTYLVELLNHHPAILITNESRILSWLRESFITLPSDKENLYVANSDGFEMLSRIRHYSIHVVRQYYEQTKPGIQYWGDKNPFYGSTRVQANFLRDIVSIFPKAKFIHIIRDGRDVVASILQKKLPSGKAWAEFDGAHNIWKDVVYTSKRFGKKIGKEQYLELKYETLVEDDLTMAKNIFDFLGLPMSPQVEEFCVQQKNKRTPFSSPTRNLKEGTRESNWNKVLNKYEQKRSIELLKDYLVYLNYLSENRMNRIKSTIKIKIGRLSSTKK